jgi:hypothetical protein
MEPKRSIHQDKEIKFDVAGVDKENGLFGPVLSPSKLIFILYYHNTAPSCLKSIPTPPQKQHCPILSKN